MLAVKILQAQNVDVETISFTSNFFSADKGRQAAGKLGVRHHIINIESELIELVKNPPSGYGKNLNPCVDCHALMIKTAWDKLGTGFDLIATGEVIGQRPFSQNRESLIRVAKLAGVEILRPLSAKLLPETNCETKGLVIRGRLLNISGRTRKRQFELAEKYGLKNFPAPAGGCLLTDPEFSARLMKLLDYYPEFTANDAEILKYGRVFWLSLSGGGRILLVVGRSQSDNENLLKFREPSDAILEIIGEVGPTTLIRPVNCEPVMSTSSPRTENEILEIVIPQELKMSGLNLGEDKSVEEVLSIAALLTGYHSTKVRGKSIKIKIN